MYRICTFWGILSLIPLFSFAYEMENHKIDEPSTMVHDILKRMYAKEGTQCQKSISFGSCDINKRGGFVIKKPGKYCLKENVNVTQSGPAITVTASNVVISLNQHTLSGQDTSTIGIVANNSTNLIIENGAVRNFTVNGISINGSDDITLDNLLILQNGTIDGPITTGGLLLINSSQIDMNAINLSENYQFGLGMTGVDTANFINSRSDKTKGYNSGSIFGNAAYGVNVSSTGAAPFTSGSSNLNFINSVVDHTTAGDSAFGFYIDSLAIGSTPVGTNQNIIIANCTVNNTSQTNVSPAGGLYFAEGITTAGGLKVTYKNCTVDTINAAATTDFPSSHIVGIEVAASNFAIIEGCSVSNLNATANYVHGLDIEGSGNDITFNKCIAYNINNFSTNPAHYALGYAILKPLGFPTIDAVGTGTVVENCIAQNVHGPNGATAAGLLINAEKNLVVENNIFNNSDNGIIARDISTAENPALVSSNNLISNNITAGNTYYGILDNTTLTAKNAYYKNVARANGISNFSGLPAGTPIVTWIIGGPFPVPVEGELDNYSIIP